MSDEKDPQEIHDTDEPQTSPIPADGTQPGTTEGPGSPDPGTTEGPGH